MSLKCMKKEQHEMEGHSSVLLDKDVDDLEREHLTDLLLRQAGGGELGAGDLPVRVLVHLCEGGLCHQILRLGLRIVGLYQAVHVLYQPLHLLLIDRAVAVHVENAENFLQNLLWGSVGHNVEDQHELDKVNVAVVVGVVDPEDVLLHLGRVALGHRLLHHLPELLWLHLAVGVGLQEGSKVLLDLGGIHATGLGEGGNVLLPEHGGSILVAHTEVGLEEVLEPGRVVAGD